MSQSILQERDGFQVRKDEFTLPADTWELDPQSKRAVTICNLFVNHQYNIPDIVRVLDENHTNVINALLKKGIIRDRRLRQRTLPGGIEHRTTVVSPNETLETPSKQILNSDTENKELI